MIRTLATLFAMSVLQLAIVSLLVFVLVNASHGDPAADLAGEGATPAQVAAVNAKLGLDRPFYVQYGDWFDSAVTGDLGRSLSTNQKVTSILAQRIPVSLSLGLMALSFAVVTATVLGIASALRPGGLVDRAVLLLTSLAVAIPSFWLALLLISQFAITRRWLPAVGYVSFGDDPVEWLRHLLLPAITLSSVVAAELTRQFRGSLLTALGTDYVLSARANGLPAWRVVLRHALRNALVPVTALLGVRVSQLLAGTVIVETIFNLQGLGRMAVTATQGRDIPVVLGVTLFAAVLVLASGIIVNVLHPLLNPKLRSEQ